MTGFAEYKGEPVLRRRARQKGGDTKQKIFRNFGYARPEGYRKALRAMRLAEKFSRPIIVFVDTPAAYPGIESEERGVAEAIAVNLREMMLLDTPIVVIVSGEGGSGGALGHRDRRPRADAGVRDLQRHPAGRAAPRSCGATRTEKVEAAAGAEADRARPARGRHHRRDRARAGRRRAHRSRRPPPRCVDQALAAALAEVCRARRSQTRARARATSKFRNMGQPGMDFVGRGANCCRSRSSAKPCRPIESHPHRRSSNRSARAGNSTAVRRRRGGALAAALGVAAGRRAAAVPARLRRPGGGVPLPEPVARSPARSDAAGRHADGRRAHRWRAIARARAHRHPRRLRRRRHHVHRDPAPGARAAGRRRASTSSPSGCSDGYGLQPAAIERLHADGVRAGRLGRLRHPRRRRGAAARASSASI